MAERATRERAPAKQTGGEPAARARTAEPTEEVVPRWSGGPDEWAGALRHDRPTDDERSLAGALGASAGNAALQRFISTSITGRSSRSAPTKPKASTTRGPGKAGKATFKFTKQGEIETPIESFSFGAAAPHDFATGQASHKATFQDISFVRQSDDLSPMFMSAEAMNEAMSIELHLTAPGGDGGATEAFVYSFTAAHLSSFTQSGGAGAPTETLKARFGGWSLKTPEQGKPPTAGGDAGTMNVPELSAKAIPLHALSWGAASPTDTATGQSSGKVRRQALSITKDMDGASTKLLSYLTTHAVLPKATFVLSGGASENGKPAPSAGEIELQQVEVASIQQSAAGGKPVETVGFIFNEIGVSANDGGGAAHDAPAEVEVEGTRRGKYSSPVLSWRAGMTSPGSMSTGMPSGKRRHQAFEMTVPAGPATVHFLGALEENEILKTARLTPKSGPSFGLGNAHVIGLELGTGDKQQATTTVKLVYQVIEETAGKNAAIDSWSSEGQGGAGATAGAKPSGATPPGPGKAGRATLTFSKQGAFETPIEAFSFGGAAPHDLATGNKSGKTQYQDLVLTRQSDSLSPILFNAEATNETMSLQVRLVAPKADGSSSETFTYDFTQARMTSFIQTGGAGSPSETINLHFGGWSLATPSGGKDEAAAAQGEAGTFSAKELSTEAIKLHAVSWGATRPTDRATGMGQGKVQQKQVSITKDMDQSSPKLLGKLQNNAVIPAATLVMASGGTMELKNVAIGSVTQSAGQERPTETVTLMFEDLEYEVQQGGGEAKDAPGFFQADGTRAGPFSSPALKWSWGMSTPGQQGIGSTGKRKLQDFEVTLPAGGPSAAHALSALDTNEVLRTATLIPKSGSTFSLTNASVADLQLAADDEQHPTATIKLTYQAVAQEAGGKFAQDSRVDST